MSETKRVISAAIAAVVAGIGGASERAFGQVDLFGIGDLPGGLFFGFSNGMSDDGEVIVGVSRSNRGYEAYRWTDQAGIQALGAGGGQNTRANAVSGDGLTTVGVGDYASHEAITWFEWGNVRRLGDLAGGEFHSDARAVNSDGSVVVGRGTSGQGIEAFRWTLAAGMVGLGDLDGGEFRSLARGVSADGAVIVGEGAGELGREAFRWTSNSGMQGLGDLPGGDFWSVATAVSDDGVVTIGSASTAVGTEAFRWTAANGIEGLGNHDGQILFSEAQALSGDGSVIVGAMQNANGEAAFIWTETDGLRDLSHVLQSDYGIDLGGWTLLGARAISADGRVISGIGYNPSGWVETWVVRIPSPGSVSVLASGLVAVVSGRRRTPAERGT